MSSWGASWVTGISLIALTIAMHAVGLVAMTLVLDRMRDWLVPHKMPRRVAIVTAILAISSAGGALAVLHATEAAIWAVAYLMAGAIDTPSDAILYSVDSMTTRGASGLTLTAEWRLMGALESANGILLFGISTAYLFAILQNVWPILTGQPIAAARLDAAREE